MSQFCNELKTCTIIIFKFFSVKICFGKVMNNILTFYTKDNMYKIKIKFKNYERLIY